MTDKQPEALRLAEQMEDGRWQGMNDLLAAAELRRLHEENEALRARLAQPEPDKSTSQKLREAGYTKRERVNVLMEQVRDEEPEPLAWQVIPEGVPAKPLTEMKAKSIIDRDGFVVGGYILDRETDVCLVHHSAVRWMKYDELFQILHVTAPPQREWQGLTDEEIWSDGDSFVTSEAGIKQFARAIEAKLKEKNT